MMTTYAASASRPLCFNNKNSNNLTSLVSQTQSPIVGLNCSCISLTKRVGPIKASYESRATLGSNWDIHVPEPEPEPETEPAPTTPPKSPATWMPTLEELDTTNMLLRNRIVFLGSQVEDMTADYIISQLLLLDAEDSKKDIKLFINSPGGSITAGMGIYDAMKMCKADVSTVCLGLAASMGAFLLASGTKGKRYCMPNAKVMIHQASGTSGGRVIDSAIRVREMVYLGTKINKILSRITGKSEKRIERDTERDNFMTSWEAKEYGLVDVVIDDGKPGLVAPIGEVLPPFKNLVWHEHRVEDDRKLRLKKQITLPSEKKFLEERRENDSGMESEKEAPAAA